MKPNPAQQKQYDVFITQARKILYDQTSIEALFKKLQSSDATKAVGHTAAMVAKSIKGGMEQQNMPVEDAVVAGAVKMLVNDILEIVVSADIIPKEKAKAIAKDAVMQAMQFLNAPDKAPQQPQQGGPELPPQQPQQPAPQGMVQQAMGA